MHRKGSMELSVNSIVILVIAVVMMGLILGFIRSKFTDIGGGFLVDENPAPEATASDPITMSRFQLPVTGVKKMGLNINFYNVGASTIYNVTPLFHCRTSAGSPIIVGEYFRKTASTSTMTTFTGNIKLQSSVPKDTYLCKVCFSRLNNTVSGQLCNPGINGLTLPNTAAEKEFELIVQ